MVVVLARPVDSVRYAQSHRRNDDGGRIGVSNGSNRPEIFLVRVVTSKPVGRAA